MSYKLESNDDFYDIDAILCEATPVPATFTHDCIGLGYLESIDTEDIAVNTKLDIPYWLMLYLTMHDHVTTYLPAKLYSQKFLSCITDDSVLYTDLCSRCDYYYELGLRYCLLTDNTQLCNNLRIIYNNRYDVILHRSTTQRSNDHNAFISKLTRCESQLYDIKQYIALITHDWRTRFGMYFRAGQLTHTINVLQNITNTAAKQDINKQNNSDTGQSSALTKQSSRFINARTTSHIEGDEENTYNNKRHRA